MNNRKDEIWSEEERAVYNKLNGVEEAPRFYGVRGMMRIATTNEKLEKMLRVLRMLVNGKQPTEKIQKILPTGVNSFDNVAVKVLKYLTHEEDEVDKEFLMEGLNLLKASYNDYLPQSLEAIQVTVLSRLDDNQTLDYSYTLRRVKEVIVSLTPYNGFINELEGFDEEIPNYFDPRVRLINDDDPKEGLKAIIKDGWSFDDDNPIDVESIVDWSIEENGKQVNALLRKAFATMVVGVTRMPKIQDVTIDKVTFEKVTK
jgi:hypothetical protein